MTMTPQVGWVANVYDDARIGGWRPIVFLLKNEARTAKEVSGLRRIAVVRIKSIKEGVTLGEK